MHAFGAKREEGFKNDEDKCFSALFGCKIGFFGGVKGAEGVVRRRDKTPYGA